jgi:hypothetical protein
VKEITEFPRIGFTADYASIPLNEEVFVPTDYIYSRGVNIWMLEEKKMKEQIKEGETELVVYEDRIRRGYVIKYRYTLRSKNSPIRDNDKEIKGPIFPIKKKLLPDRIKIGKYWYDMEWGLILGAVLIFSFGIYAFFTYFWTALAYTILGIVLGLIFKS